LTMDFLAISAFKLSKCSIFGMSSPGCLSMYASHLYNKSSGVILYAPQISKPEKQNYNGIPQTQSATANITFGNQILVR
jgi:hypothetical protein